MWSPPAPQGFFFCVRPSAKASWPPPAPCRMPALWMAGPGRARAGLPRSCRGPSARRLPAGAGPPEPEGPAGGVPRYPPGTPPSLRAVSDEAVVRARFEEYARRLDEQELAAVELLRGGVSEHGSESRREASEKARAARAALLAAVRAMAG